MPIHLWIIICVAAFVALSFAAMFIITRIAAKKEYAERLIRTSPDKWARANSCPENAEHSLMYDEGIAWGEAHKASMKPVSVESCGLKLMGEYFDFGSENCVIIIPGRAESLKYSYYFAPPYEKAGYNVLVIDTRAHGLSEGKNVGLGIGEIPDAIAWLRMLETMGVKKTVVHGVCVGASTAVMASVREDCPDILAGVVAEGLFKSFYTIFKQRTKNGGHPTFMFMWQIYDLAKRYAGVDIKRTAPEFIMDRVKCPILFLHSKKDDSSLPECAQQLYDACGSERKRIVWFDKGAHSHIRIANAEKYDAEITGFLSTL